MSCDQDCDELIGVTALNDESQTINRLLEWDAKIEAGVGVKRAFTPPNDSDGGLRAG